MPERIDYLADEIQRLRDWRHDTNPRLEALAQLMLDTRERLGRLEGTVDRLEDSTEIATAVTDALHRNRVSLLTRTERLLAFLLAIPGLALTVVELVRAFG